MRKNREFRASGKQSQSDCLAQVESLAGRLTVMDLGASGGGHPEFHRCMQTFKHVLHIQIDPDAREFDATTQTERVMSIAKAVVETDEKETVKLYLTKSPYCSSTLRPVAENLERFTYYDLFEIVETTEIAATTLNRIVTLAETPIHWIKLDSQGTELRLLQSLDRAAFNQLLCVDAELGIYEHYQGQDRFGAFHEFMLANGFYLSEVTQIQSRLRMSKQCLEEYLESNGAENSLNRWPTAIECRYLRNFDTKQNDASLESLCRTWMISFCVRDFTYCLHLISVLRVRDSQKKQLWDDLRVIVYEQLAYVATQMKNRDRLNRIVNRIVRALRLQQ